MMERHATGGLRLLVRSLTEADVLPAFQLQPGQQTSSRKMCQRHVDFGW